MSIKYSIDICDIPMQFNIDLLCLKTICCYVTTSFHIDQSINKMIPLSHDIIRHKNKIFIIFSYTNQ
jgi:hypothetical protein